MALKQNQRFADAFQSIDEFLNVQQTQLKVLEERSKQLGDELRRLTIIGKHRLEEQKRFDLLEKRIYSLEQVIQEGGNRLSLMEDTLVALETQFNDREYQTQKIAEILPHVIHQAKTTLDSSNSFEGTELVESLQIPVELCIKQSISQDPHPFADTLFPVMGPAIRKAINETFKNLMQAINQAAEHSLSPQGLAWRLEARRKGLPFSEIVLEKTLIFRVEQVFLIHRESGLLIQHLHKTEVKLGDSDAISAMLTAIQDFIRDSFSESKTEELDSVEIGNYTVWLERGPYAVLACVIRGVAPHQLRNLMRNSLEIVHARYGVLLQAFSGDAVPLKACLPFLEKTLQSESKAGAQKARLMSPSLIVILSLVLLGALGWGYWHFQSQQRLTNYVEALQNTPGFVVISTQEQDGKLLTYGMRDPLAIESREIAQTFELSEDEVESFWTPYQDLSPAFVEKRVHLHLKPPATVSVRLEANVLYLSGHASQHWIDKASASIFPGIDRVVMDDLLETDLFLLALAKRTLLPPDNVTLVVQERVLQLKGEVDTTTFEALQKRIQALPREAFARFDSSALRDVERERQLIIQRIEKNTFYFYKESARFLTGQEKALKALVEDVQQLLVHSQALHQSVRLQIIGSSDGRGPKIFNQRLIQQRAQKVFDWLQRHGIKKEQLMITPPPVIRFGGKKANPSERKVNFHVFWSPKL